MHNNFHTFGQNRTGAFRFDHRHPFFQIEQRAFVAIDRNPDNQTVNQLAGASDDVDMPVSYRVKRAGVKANAHDLSCRSGRLVGNFRTRGPE